MTISFRTTIFVLGILLSQMMSACAPQTPEAQTSEPQSTIFASVSIPDSQVRQLESATTGRNYDIYVLLPPNYAQNPQKKYPVLYVLDGQWDFKLLDSIYGGLLYDEFVPEMIIVGITYSGEDADYNALRAMDYTPVRDPFVAGSGDAPKFFAFLKEQLIPFIESEYRADASQRVLMGSSYGGTFTLYALFSEPGLFSGYVAASPAVPYGGRFAFEQEAEYAASHKDLPVRLFLSVGGIEELRLPVEEFMHILSERNYTGLEMETRIIEGERHAGNKPEAYNRGLRFIFQDK
jgi:predicted alpha/beta superfamily hydrolase